MVYFKETFDDERVLMDSKLLKRFDKQGIVCVCVFLVILSAFLFFISMSSPFYLFNGDEDTNVYMMVSEQMEDGKIMYRDIFDHKGPVWYFVFDFFYRLDRSCCFLYFIQIFSGAIFFIYSCKIFNLLTNRKMIGNYVAMMACCLSVYLSPVIESGGRPDEFALPFASYAIYLIVKYIKTNESIKIYQYFLVGLQMGAFLWTKFTLLWFYFSLFIFLIYVKHPHIIQRALVTLSGIVLFTMPVMLYFWANGALSDLFDIYIFANLFEYESAISSFVMQLYYNVGEILYTYGVFWLVVGIAVVFIGIFYKNNENIRLSFKKYVMLLLFVSSMFAVFGLLRVSYSYYYAQAFSVLPVLFYVFEECIRLDKYCADKFQAVLKSRKAIFVVSGVGMLLVGYQIYLLQSKLGIFDTPNLFTPDAQEYMCFRVADYVKSHPSGSVKVVGWDTGYQHLLDFDYYPKDEYYVASVNLRTDDINASVRNSIIAHKYGYIVLSDRRMEVWDNNQQFFEMNGYELLMDGFDDFTKVGLFKYSGSCE